MIALLVRVEVAVLPMIQMGQLEEETTRGGRRVSNKSTKTKREQSDTLEVKMIELNK